MSETERLFFALWPDPAVAARMAALGEEAAGGRGRRIPAEKLHLTLTFLGDVDAATRACVERVGDGVEQPPFEMVLDRIGHFRRAQVVWIGPSEPPEVLPGLVGALNAGLSECGFAPPTRPFRAHITLARKVRRAQARHVSPLPWPVGRFVLVRSTLKSAGAEYEVVREWPLRA